MLRTRKGKDGWGSASKTRGVLITTYHAGSPFARLTESAMGCWPLTVFVSNLWASEKLIAGRTADELSHDVVHEGIMSSVVEQPASPQHGVSLKGKGNERWRDWIKTRQVRERRVDRQGSGTRKSVAFRQEHVMVFGGNTSSESDI